MKKHFFAILATICCMSCTNPMIDTEEDTKSITFQLFERTETPMTRASSSSDQYLLIIDECNGTIMNVTPDGHTGVNTLDNVTLHLKYGAHKLYFVTYESPYKTLDLANLKLTWQKDTNKLKNVHTATKEITVTNNTIANQSIELERKVSLIEIKFTDEIPANLAKIKMNITGLSWTYDLKNNKGIEAGVYEETTTEVSSIIGKTNISLYVYTFIPETGVIGNYTITAYDSSDQVIKTQTITGVSVTANKHITYSGDFFSNDAPFSFTVNDTWDTEDRNL